MNNMEVESLKMSKVGIEDKWVIKEETLVENHMEEKYSEKRDGRGHHS